MSFGYGMSPYGAGYYNPALGGLGAGQMYYPSMPGLSMAPFAAPYAPGFVSPYIPPVAAPFGAPINQFLSPFPLETMETMPFFGAPPLGVGGFGGLQPSGRSMSAQFMSTGLPNDTDIEEMIYDAIDVDPLIPADTQIDVTCEAGSCTLTGDVPNKMVKHAAGQDAWWTTGVVDVRNELNVTGEGPAEVKKPKARLGQKHAAQASQLPSGRQQPQQHEHTAEYHAQQAQYHAQQAQQYAQHGGQQGQ